MVTLRFLTLAVLLHASFGQVENLEELSQLVPQSLLDQKMVTETTVIPSWTIVTRDSVPTGLSEKAFVPMPTSSVCTTTEDSSTFPAGQATEMNAALASTFSETPTLMATIENTQENQVDKTTTSSICSSSTPKNSMKMTPSPDEKGTKLDVSSTECTSTLKSVTTELKPRTTVSFDIERVTKGSIVARPTSTSSCTQEKTKEPVTIVKRSASQENNMSTSSCTTLEQKTKKSVVIEAVTSTKKNDNLPTSSCTTIKKRTSETVVAAAATSTDEKMQITTSSCTSLQKSTKPAMTENPPIKSTMVVQSKADTSTHKSKYTEEPVSSEAATKKKTTTNDMATSKIPRKTTTCSDKTSASVQIAQTSVPVKISSTSCSEELSTTLPKKTTMKVLSTPCKSSEETQSKAFLTATPITTVTSQTIPTPNHDLDPPHIPYDPEPAALLNISFRGYVGTWIPPSSSPYPFFSKLANSSSFVLPNETYQKLVTGIMNPPEGYWRRKAVSQIRMLIHRQYYRTSHMNDEDASVRGPLLLPPDDVWKIEIDPKNIGPRIVTRGTKGLAYVVVEYTFFSVIVARRGSVQYVEPLLQNANSKISETRFLPLDPEFLFQRTGYACADQSRQPNLSVNGYNIWMIYDEACGGKISPYSSKCRLSNQKPLNISCRQALRNTNGVYKVILNWKRLTYDPQLVDDYRVGNITQLTADLKNLSPSTPKIVYKYFPRSICLPAKCIDTYGWRRIYMFTSTVVNGGAFRLHLGHVKSNESYLVKANLYSWNSCLNDFQYVSFMKNYMDKKVENVATSCIHSSERLLNNEHTPMFTSFLRCNYQGLSPGWGFSVPLGTTCHWFDITTKYNLRSKPLISRANPDNLMCEGMIGLTSKRPRKQILIESNVTTASGAPVMKPTCRNHTEDLRLNNFANMTAMIGGRSATTTRLCRYPRPYTHLRDCGWSIFIEALDCKPGEVTTFNAMLAKDGTDYYNTPIPANLTLNVRIPVIIRVCESSHVLGRLSTRCQFVDALSHGLIVPGKESTVSFVCPVARDTDEKGGLFSIMYAKLVTWEALNVVVPPIAVKYNETIHWPLSLITDKVVASRH